MQLYSSLSNWLPNIQNLVKVNNVPRRQTVRAGKEEKISFYFLFDRRMTLTGKFCSVQKRYDEYSEWKENLIYCWLPPLLLADELNHTDVK